MAQFVKCATCGKPYLDKGGTACPHCARAGRPATPAPVSVPKSAPKKPAPPAPSPEPAVAESKPAEEVAEARKSASPSPAPQAAEPEKSAQPPEEAAAVEPEAVEPEPPVSSAAATMMAIPAVSVPEPVAPIPPESDPEPAPEPVEVPPVASAPPAPARPTPPQPAEIPMAAKTLVFAPIAPPAEPPAQEPRSEVRPVPVDTPIRQTGSMEVRPMKVTPVVGVAKVITRASGPLDLSTLTPPPGGGKRPTADVIGAPKPSDPHEKAEARAKPAHAEGVRVVVPDAPVMEVGQEAASAGAESGKPAEPIRALRVRLTQELQIVKPPEPSKRKVIIVAALGGMGAALLIWLLISIIW